ncbi:MAG TPA: 50S ribosomal protein L13 [Alphaproteobacteria bacterium]|nr:50S ribosomal protein L13 [Alphaproteobacteria bacterium]
MKTMSLSAEAAAKQKNWVLIDAENVVLGRLASVVALRLKGKHKPTYTPHVDCGDNVIVINAEKVRVTGRKMTDRVFYWYTGHIGGVKQRTPQQTLSGKHPERLIEKAVERMLKKESPLARRQLSNLKVYKGAEHPHAAQNPTVLDLAKMNPKNKRSA